MAGNWIATEGITVGQLLDTLKARKALILTILFLVLATALGVTALLPPWYKSTVRISVSKPEGKVALFNSERMGGSYDPFFTQEQLEIIQSKKILYKVIENLNLQQTLGDAFNDGDELSENVSYQILLNQMLNVAPSLQGTSLIDITVWAKNDSELAAVIANAIAKIYADDRVAFAVSDQTEGINRLKSELVKQEEVVRKQRDVVEKLRNDLGVSGVDIKIDHVDLEIESLRNMEANLLTLQLEATGRKARWENFSEIPEEQRLSVANSELITDPNIAQLIEDQLLARQEYVKLQRRLGKNHPDYKSAQDNLNEITRQLNELLSGYEKSLELSFLEARAQVQEMNRQLEEAKLAQISSASTQMRPFQEAIEKLREEDQIYQDIKHTLRQREIDFQAPKKSIEILNQAEPATRPGRPNWVLNGILAFLVGGTLGVSMAFAIELLDTSFRSVADIETRLNLNVMGVVTRKGARLDADSLSGPPGEAYRVIQANVEIAAAKEPLFVMAVQSAGPGEGKSTMASSLASVMALSGLKVLLVDGDLRRPTQHRYSSVDREPGLSEFFADKDSKEPRIQKSKVEGLDVVSAGAKPQNLSVAETRRLKDWLETVKDKYDRVILDSPPVIGVSDATLLTTIVDASLLVIQHRRNPQSMTLRARDTILNTGTRIVGAVLNQVPESGDADFNYYTSNYAYYSDRAYQRKDRSPPTQDKDKSSDSVQLKG